MQLGLYSRYKARISHTDKNRNHTISTCHGDGKWNSKTLSEIRINSYLLLYSALLLFLNCKCVHLDRHQQSEGILYRDEN
jgi:hypothetical protein